jgi:hypothetical protein
LVMRTPKTLGQCSVWEPLQRRTSRESGQLHSSLQPSQPHSSFSHPSKMCDGLLYMQHCDNFLRSKSHQVPRPSSCGRRAASLVAGCDLGRTCIYLKRCGNSRKVLRSTRSVVVHVPGSCTRKRRLFWHQIVFRPKNGQVACRRVRATTREK